jgi:hypothetical protein
MMALERGQGYVLTAADNGLGSRQGFQFGTQGEGAFHGSGEAEGTVASGEQAAGAAGQAGGRITRDFTLGQREIEPAGAAGIIDVRHRGLLPFVRGDTAGIRDAAHQQRKFEIRRQAETAGKVIAAFTPGFGTAAKEHGFEPVIAFGGYRPTAGKIAQAGQSERLGELRGLSGQSGSEAQETRPGGLFGDGDEARALLRHVAGDGGQQRSGAGHYDAFAGNGQATLHKRLQAAGAGYAGQRPAGKGEEALAGPGGDDELAVAEERRPSRRFGPQHAGFGLVDHDSVGDDLQIRRAAGPRTRDRRLAAPDLAAGRGIVIQHENIAPGLLCRARSRDSGWAGANDEESAGAGRRSGAVQGRGACDVRGRSLGAHLHARRAESLATSAMRHAVDGDAAFQADAHPAQRAESGLAARENRGGYGGAFRNGDRLAIYAEWNRHGWYGAGLMAGLRPAISSASI